MCGVFLTTVNPNNQSSAHKKWFGFYRKERTLRLTDVSSKREK